MNVILETFLKKERNSDRQVVDHSCYLTVVNLTGTRVCVCLARTLCKLSPLCRVRALIKEEVGLIRGFEGDLRGVFHELWDHGTLKMSQL